MTHKYCLGTHNFQYIIFSKKYKVGMVFCTFDKSKHLELSDSILGLSQIFSDTI